MRQILRAVFFLLLLISMPIIWLIAYAFAGTKEANEHCKEVLHLMWHGEE